MNWFLHNTVADLYGPYFLVFYGAAIVVLIVAARRSIRSVDRTRELEPPEISAKLDPYEVAYLRGGENEATRVAIASLFQRGLLRIVEEKKRGSTTKKIGRGREPEGRELSPIEAAVYGWTGFPAEPQKIFASGGISPRVKEACGRYEIDLAEENLLAPREEMKDRVRWLWSFGFMAITLLGGYKLVVAHAKGHSNVAFLWIMMFVGVLAYSVACWALPRLSHRGKAYLERLKLAYGGLKDQLQGAEDWGLGLDVAEWGPRAGAKTATAYSDGLLLVGIFGMTSLADTPLADLKSMFAQGSSGGGCGGGCGGGGCGGGCGGGGCGGCGG
jgi:uncharacterized protein (TIGR04222 family)